MQCPDKRNPIEAYPLRPQYVLPVKPPAEHRAAAAPQLTRFKPGYTSLYHQKNIFFREGRFTVARTGQARARFPTNGKKFPPTETTNISSNQDSLILNLN